MFEFFVKPNPEELAVVRSEFAEIKNLAPCIYPGFISYVSDNLSRVIQRKNLSFVRDLTLSGEGGGRRIGVTFFGNDGLPTNLRLDGKDTDPENILDITFKKDLSIRISRSELHSSRLERPVGNEEEFSSFEGKSLLHVIKQDLAEKRVNAVSRLTSDRYNYFSQMPEVSRGLVAKSIKALGIESIHNVEVFGEKNLQTSPRQAVDLFIDGSLIGEGTTSELISAQDQHGYRTEFTYAAPRRPDGAYKVISLTYPNEEFVVRLKPLASESPYIPGKQIDADWREYEFLKDLKGEDAWKIYNGDESQPLVLLAATPNRMRGLRGLFPDSEEATALT